MVGFGDGGGWVCRAEMEGGVVPVHPAVVLQSHQYDYGQDRAFASTEKFRVDRSFWPGPRPDELKPAQPAPL